MPTFRGILIVNSVIPGVINKATVVHKLIPGSPLLVHSDSSLASVRLSFPRRFSLAFFRAAQPWPVPSINEHLLWPY